MQNHIPRRQVGFEIRPQTDIENRTNAIVTQAKQALLGSLYANNVRGMSHVRTYSLPIQDVEPLMPSLRHYLETGNATLSRRIQGQLYSLLNKVWDYTDSDRNIIAPNNDAATHLHKIDQAFSKMEHDFDSDDDNDQYLEHRNTLAEKGWFELPAESLCVFIAKSTNVTYLNDEDGSETQLPPASLSMVYSQNTVFVKSPNESGGKDHPVFGLKVEL